MTKTSFILQEEGSDHFYLGRCSKKTLGNRISQLRMGNVRDIKYLSSALLSDSDHDLLKAEINPFAIKRGWHKIPQSNVDIIALLNHLEGMYGVGGVSDKVLRLAKRNQGKTCAEFLLELSDSIALTRNMLKLQVKSLSDHGKLQTNPTVQVHT